METRRHIAEFWKTTTRLVGVTLVVAALCLGGIYLTSSITRVATIWFANGFLVGVMLRSPPRKWSGLLAAGLFGNIIADGVAGDASWLAVQMSLCNTIEIALTCGVLYRFIDRDLTPHRLAAQARAILSVVVLTPILPSLLGAWIYAGADNGSDLLDDFCLWYPADVLGIVIATPFVLVVSSGRLPHLFSGKNRVRNLTVLALLIGTTMAVFGQSEYPLLFVVFPPLLMTVFEMELMGAALGLLIVCALAIGFTATGHGPFVLVHASSMPARMLFVQFFVAIASLMAYPVGVALSGRRAMQKRMRDNEHRYRTLSENSSDMIVCASLDGKRTYVSPSVVELLGWYPEEIIGAKRSELVHPEDRPVFEAEQAAFRLGQRSSVLVYRFRHKLGHYIWVESRSRLTHGTGPSGQDEIVKVVRDISVRKQMEHALAKSEADLRAITDNVPALISFLDADGVIQFCNATHEAWLQRSRDEMVGRHLSEVLGPSAYEQQRAGFIRALTGENAEIDLTINGRRTRVSYVPRWSAAGEINGAYAITSDLTAIREAKDELERLANFDALTGVANRHCFNEGLKDAVANHKERKQSMALLFLDVDRFKHINDTHGHAVGDEVLVEVARRLKLSVREGDLIARLAGDEFVVLMRSKRLREEPNRVAQRIVEALREPFASSAGTLELSVSVGVAFVVETPNKPEEILRCADDALYAAKAAGRNTWRSAFCYSRGAANADSASVH